MTITLFTLLLSSIGHMHNNAVGSHDNHVTNLHRDGTVVLDGKGQRISVCVCACVWQRNSQQCHLNKHVVHVYYVNVVMLLTIDLASKLQSEYGGYHWRRRLTLTRRRHVP